VARSARTNARFWLHPDPRLRWARIVLSARTSYLLEDDFRGTFAPFFRASDKPIAIACFRLFTLPPLPPFPDFSVPAFSRCIALFTDFLEASPYRAMYPPVRPKLLGQSLNLGSDPSVADHKGLQNQALPVANVLNIRTARPKLVRRTVCIKSVIRKCSSGKHPMEMPNRSTYHAIRHLIGESSTHTGCGGVTHPLNHRPCVRSEKRAGKKDDANSRCR
jgi:hypothetical protein